jgi:hypothetical protein
VPACPGCTPQPPAPSPRSGAFPQGDAKGKEGAAAEAAGSSKAGPGKKTGEKAGKKGGKKTVGTGKGAKDDAQGPAKKDGGAKSKTDKKKEAKKPANKVRGHTCMLNLVCMLSQKYARNYADELLKCTQAPHPSQAPFSRQHSV